MNNLDNNENKNEQVKKRYNTGIDYNNKYRYFSLAALIVAIIGIIVTALPFTGPFFGIPLAIVSVFLSIFGMKCYKWHTLNNYSIVVDILNFIVGAVLIFVL
ncbi:MAG: hypothetical protein K5892_02115 [Acholeplasmatales bacterium]|nr:hypothetical protein [Acholeplasmatales bacterium]